MGPVIPGVCAGIDGPHRICSLSAVWWKQHHIWLQRLNCQVSKGKLIINSVRSNGPTLYPVAMYFPREPQWDNKLSKRNIPCATWVCLLANVSSSSDLGLYGSLAEGHSVALLVHCCIDSNFHYFSLNTVPTSGSTLYPYLWFLYVSKSVEKLSVRTIWPMPIFMTY